MIVIQDRLLLVRIDPGHGSEVLDLVDLTTGRQLLARTPWGTIAQPGDLDEATWTAGYRGGWQALLPNAGNPSNVGDVEHGFHGRASVDPWEPVEVGPTRASLTWEGHGISARRTFNVEDGALRVATELRGIADEPAPLVMVEHLALGVELLEPEAELVLSPAPAYELDDGGSPTQPPANAGTWPDVRLLDGSLERADRLSLETPGRRMIALSPVTHGWAAVRNPARGQGLAAAWDTSWFGHMWMWREARTLTDQWRGLAELLVLEPATVPHHVGLADALVSGHARRLARGETVSTWIVVRPFRSDRPVESVDADARVR